MYVPNTFPYRTKLANICKLVIREGAMYYGRQLIFRNKYHIVKHFASFLFLSLLGSISLAQGGFGPQQTISYSADMVVQIFAADLDGDGDDDALSASQGDNKIAWYENLGSGSFGPIQVISTNAMWAQGVYAIDLDADGDNDVISASYNDDKIALYQNDGSGNFGAEIVLTNALNGAIHVIASDVDNDGDHDILGCGLFSNEIAYFENLGSGVFNTMIAVANPYAPVHVEAADVDLDGDQDLLCSSHLNVYLYENMGGSPPSFGPAVIIDAGYSGGSYTKVSVRASTSFLKFFMAVDL